MTELETARSMRAEIESLSLQVQQQHALNEKLNTLKISDSWLNDLKLSPASLQSLLHRSDEDFKTFPIEDKAISKNKLNKFVALDCEMVSSVENSNFPARISLVDYYGDVIIDHYVFPKSKITDYRKKYSGITPQIMQRAKQNNRVMTLEQAQERIKKLVKNGFVVVGHDVRNDLKALQLQINANQIIDTQKLSRFTQEAKGNGLKRLLLHYFNIQIQVGKNGHDSVEDARASMMLLRAFRGEFTRTT